MGKIHTYRDHSITLDTERKDAGWIGKYCVRALGRQDTHSHSDCAPGDFTTQTKANQAALEAAKRWIDYVHRV